MKAKKGSGFRARFSLDIVLGNWDSGNAPMLRSHNMLHRPSTMTKGGIVNEFLMQYATEGQLNSRHRIHLDLQPI